MVEQILYKTLAILMMFLGLYTIVWGYFFSRETDRLWKEYRDRKERIDKAINKGGWTPRRAEFNPGSWISADRLDDSK